MLHNQVGFERFLFVSYLPMATFAFSIQVPEDEKNLGPFDRLIHVYHFTKDTQNQTVMMETWLMFICIYKKNTA